jgi:hypothetical protein
MAQKQKNLSVKPGDRFMRVGETNTIWIVERLLDLHGVPQHLRLVNIGGHRRALTFAVSAVLDRALFRRLPVADMAAE